MLTQPAHKVHDQLLAFVERGREIRKHIEGATTGDDLLAAAPELRRWYEDGRELGNLFQRGATQIRMLGAFDGAERRAALVELGAEAQEAVRLERAGTYDRRQLNEALGRLRAAAARHITGILQLQLGIVEEIEKRLPTGTTGRTMFYSWQSDSPNATNRGFIRNALEAALSDATASLALEESPRVDSTTEGVPGSPDIAATIFEKIRHASLFVADVTIIGRVGPRPVPNPNVLLELGYAIGTLGWDRIALVCNESFGPLTDLPFDLRGRRVISYSATEGEPSRSQQKGKLVGSLRPHLIAALADAPLQESAPDLRVSVERRVSVALVGPPSSVEAIMVKAMNFSSDAVFLAGVVFELDDGTSLAGLRDVSGAFIRPKRLEPGESVVTGFAAADIEEAAKARRIVHIFLHDQLERRYYAPTSAVDEAMGYTMKSGAETKTVDGPPAYEDGGAQRANEQSDTAEAGKSISR